ncbi:MAG: MerR family transcriptional regulator [Chloroflexi bacterium]|nr:MerR family transcriptional regulator [Chloroflexota bacterium]
MLEEQQERNASVHLQIGELARRAGVTIRTVRYYEEKGLVVPADVTSGGIRLYGQKDVNRLIYIRRLRMVGLNIDEIKASLGTPANPDRNTRVQHTLKLLQMQKSKAEEKTVRLTALQTEIEHSLKIVSRCVTCAAKQCYQDCPSASHLL